MNIIINRVGRFPLYILCLLCVLCVSSCKDLDEEPDNRTHIDSPSKVQLLLTSGYPSATPALICELSGDNLLDNNVVVPSTDLYSRQNFYEQTYKWEDINNYSFGYYDSPAHVWEAYYHGIAVANHAIEAMLEMDSIPANNKDLAHSWGEAHLLRAYCHFVLVNVFAEAYKDETQSAEDMAIPYVTEAEHVVFIDYSVPKYRKSVAEFYDLIEKDILEGIDLIDDAKYDVPAYHFNRNAANALAARFYLYKRDYVKCVKYATAALGNNPASSLRKWALISTKSTDTMLKGYNDEKATCNYLIQPADSYMFRMIVDFRYAINQGTKNILYDGGGPNWRGRLKAYNGKIFQWSSHSEYGAFLFRVWEYFEYSDKIAGIGYVHALYQPFTADETLLCRAEAEIYLGQTDKALEDLGFWTASHMVDDPLTQSGINTKYIFMDKNGEKVNNMFVSDLHPTEMSPEWTFDALSNDAKCLIHCVLHFRRIETMFEGLRWFDIKRYGITVGHASRNPREDKVYIDYLQWNDPRRVLQIPQIVSGSGYPSTDRSSSLSNQDEDFQSRLEIADEP